MSENRRGVPDTTPADAITPTAKDEKPEKGEKEPRGLPLRRVPSKHDIAAEEKAKRETGGSERLAPLPDTLPVPTAKKSGEKKKPPSSCRL